MTTIAFGGGPSIEQRRSFSSLRDGSHVPGYRGYCPQIKYKVGKTYGTDTHELNQDYKKFRSVTLLEPSPSRPVHKNIPESTGDNKYTENMVPGYTGYVPRMSFKFGNTYKEDCDVCIDEFNNNTSIHDTKHRDLRRQSGSYPRLKAVYTDPFVRDKMNMYRDTHPIQPMLLEDKRTSLEPPIPGYQGYIPRINTTELGLGRRYHDTTESGLDTFYRETQRHKDLLTGRHPSQIELEASGKLAPGGSKGVSFSKSAPGFSQRLYHNDGMIPKYTGYCPQRRYNFGNTYGDTTRSLEVCAHPYRSFGEFTTMKRSKTQI